MCEHSLSSWVLLPINPTWSLCQSPPPFYSEWSPCYPPTSNHPSLKCLWHALSSSIFSNSPNRQQLPLSKLKAKPNNWFLDLSTKSPSLVNLKLSTLEWKTARVAKYFSCQIHKFALLSLLLFLTLKRQQVEDHIIGSLPKVGAGRAESNFYLIDTQWPWWDKKRLCVKIKR